MPVYLMRCPRCGHREEKQMTYDEFDKKKDLIFCPRCDDIIIMRRSIGATPLIFVGDGFTKSSNQQ